MVDGADGGGSGDGGGIDTDGDDGWLAKVAKMNLPERKRLEEEGNALFLAGRFDEVAGFPRQDKVVMVEMTATVGTPAMTKSVAGSATLQGPEELT